MNKKNKYIKDVNNRFDGKAKELLINHINLFYNDNEKIIKNKDDSLFKFGKITFKNYSFKYKLNEQLILNDIDFTINPGEKIGIIGRSGGGK